MCSNVIVSVLVISYNSQSYIMETLESIKNQTYKTIEIIVSDDCSTDTTVSICKKWIEENRNRFLDVKINVNRENLGLVGNCNKALEMCSGEYIKIIAADDILIPICIEKNLFACKSNNYDIIFSNMIIFDDNKNLNYNNDFVKKSKYFKLSNDKKINKLLEQNFIPTPTSFIKRSTLLKLGGFDERYKMMEDLPLWYKILKDDYTIGFINDYTVMYRINESSITNQNKRVINEAFFNCKQQFYIDYLRAEIISRKKFITLIDKETEYAFFRRIIKKGNNKNNINYVDNIILYLSPKRFYNLVMSKFKKL